MIVVIIFIVFGCKLPTSKKPGAKSGSRFRDDCCGITSGRLG
jgi:hypothetical protein